jgi:SPP1 gp7 family putative phage head morphogenesis protein
MVFYNVDLDQMTVGEILRYLDALTITLSPSEQQQLRQLIEQTYTMSANQTLAALPARVTAPMVDFYRPMNTAIVGYMTDYVVGHLEGVAEDSRGYLAQTLRDGYRAGESIPKLRARVQSVTGQTRVSANRSARTISNETYNQANAQVYADLEVPGLQYVAAHNEKTCSVCGALDGTIWAIDDPDIIHPTIHQNCRCRLRAYFGKIPGPRRIDQSVIDFYNNYRSKYMPIPMLAQ